MKTIEKKKCRHCRRLFLPNYRNKNRQVYCSRLPCRKASKAVSQKKWLSKPENKDYFKGPVNTNRVREWRKKHPGYWKRPKPKNALQDRLNAQHAENIHDNGQIGASTLQDLLAAQPPVIIGLISNFIGSPLQDDIANTLLAMQQSGQDILCFKPKKQGGQSDCKSPDFEISYPQSAPKLQLGRSPTGPRPAY